MTKLPHIVLPVKAPCCHAKMRLVALLDVPREIYNRTCSKCGTKWEVDRRTARVETGRRIDILEWVKLGHQRLNVLVSATSAGDAFKAPQAALVRRPRRLHDGQVRDVDVHPRWVVGHDGLVVALERK